MKLSKVGADLIKHYEGLSLVPYLCPAKYWTIGWGHRINEQERIKLVDGISMAEAMAIFDYDIAKFERGVSVLITHPLTQGQFDALVSFAFNLGLGRLQASTLRQKLNRGEISTASDELKRWVYAGGKKLPGLVKRRESERQLFLS